MRFTQLKLENWRNFLEVDVPLQRRVFIVGPNASGKSNLLDVFRFLRAVAEPEGGGIQRAVASRGGVTQIRSLHTRRKNHVGIEVEMDFGDETVWSYRLEFGQDKQRNVQVQREIVRRDGELVLERPDANDRADPKLLGQTHLEQIASNRDFRELSEALAKVRYLHIVPQLVREPERSVGRSRDPYGGDFLEQLAGTRKNVLDARLKQLTAALKIALPQLQELKLERDQRGVPHLKGLYRHWRPNAGWQGEEQFSDGTLRLLGLLWVFLDGSDPLLLEEPELSLHVAVIRHIPSMMARLSKKQKRQILVSTHSSELLGDEGIAPEEVILLEPSKKEGTKARLASGDHEIRLLLQSGVPMGEVVIPRTAPANSAQLALFGNS